TPLEYQLREADNRHCHLGEAISKWATIVGTGILDLEEKIKGIVERPVPLDNDDLDYIENILADHSTVRFFTRYAKGIDWLHWIEDKEPFARLFRTDVALTEIDRELAHWFARIFVCSHPDNALAVVRRKRGSISAGLWTAIAASF